MKTGKYYFLGIALATIAFLYIGYDLYFLAPLRKRKNRNFTVNTNDTLTGANPVNNSPQIKIGNVTIPMVDKSFFKSPDKLYAFVPNLKKMRTLFGNNIRNAAANANLPEYLIEAFILIENGAFLDPNFINKFKATGLMQVTEILATDAIMLGIQKRIVSDAEKNVIRRVLGVAKAEKIFKSKIGIEPIITAQELTNVDLNLTIACVYMNWLMVESNMTNGNWRFDIIVARYNASWTQWKAKDFVNKTPEQVYNLMKTDQTKNYIAQLVGNNSFLQLTTQV